MARYAERFRAAQLEALAAALPADADRRRRPAPEVALLLMTGVTQVLGMERALGMDAGHQADTSSLHRRRRRRSSRPQG